MKILLSLGFSDTFMVYHQKTWKTLKKGQKTITTWKFDSSQCNLNSGLSTTHCGKTNFSVFKKSKKGELILAWKFKLLQNLVFEQKIYFCHSVYIKQVVHTAEKFTFSFKKILKKLGTDFGMKIQTFTTEFEFLNQKLIFATVCIISKKSLFLPFIFLFLDALLISFLCVKNLGLNIQIITREREKSSGFLKLRSILRPLESKAFFQRRSSFLLPAWWDEEQRNRAHSDREKMVLLFPEKA